MGKRKIQEREHEEKFDRPVCELEISEDEYEDFDSMCWECWDDQLTEEFLLAVIAGELRDFVCPSLLLPKLGDYYEF